MEKMSTRVMIGAIVDSLLPLDYSKDADGFIEALVFNFDVYAVEHGYESDGRTHHPEWEDRANLLVHVVVTAHRNVFVKVTPHTLENGAFSEPLNGIELYENTSNHDTCWRSDGVKKIWETCYKLAKQVTSKVPEDKLRLPYSEHIDIHNGPFGKFITKVKVKMQSYEDPRYYGSRFKIIDIKEI